jgi:hypothetical protein
MKLPKLVLVMFMVMMAAACGSTGGAVDTQQEAARATYDAESSAYQRNVDTIVAARTAGRMTQARWDHFKQEEAAVRSADATAYTLLNEWQTTGRKPPAYDSAAATLRAAQNSVAAIAAEVSR